MSQRRPRGRRREGCNVTDWSNLMNYILPPREYRVGENIPANEIEGQKGDRIAWEDLPKFRRKAVIYHNENEEPDYQNIVVELRSAHDLFCSVYSKYTSFSVNVEDYDEKYFFDFKDRSGTFVQTHFIGR